MGKRGPQKESEKMKLLKGTWRADRDQKTAAKLEPGPADPPGWLPPEAKEKYSELAPGLIKRKLLTVIDVDEFARYCLYYVRQVEAEGEVAANGLLIKSARGDGQLVKNPACQIARDYGSMASKLGEKFGLNPTSRDGLNIEDEAQENDHISQMIARKRREQQQKKEQEMEELLSKPEDCRGYEE